MADSRMLCAALGGAVAALGVAILVEEEEVTILKSMRIGRTHKLWSHNYLLERDDEEQENTLDKLERRMLSTGSEDIFCHTVRMPVWLYQQLEAAMLPLLSKQETNYRLPIAPETRYSLTLRYIFHGDSPLTLGQVYRVGASSVLPLIRETCAAFIQKLKKRYMPTPRTYKEWLEIAAGFEELWNLPHVLGAIDGKHIKIRRPAGTVSEFYNYKGWFSIILFGSCTADKRFVYVDVGHEGRASDSTIWRDSKLHQDLLDPQNPLNIPPPASIPGIDAFPVPYYFIGDDAFALEENLMKPLPKINDKPERIYNYRISRARMPIENTFGILASRMRIFQRCQDMEPDGVKLVVLAACCLHNFLATEAREAYIPRSFADYEDPRTRQVQRGEWRRDNELTELRKENYGRQADFVRDMRKELVKYVNGPGAVPWQDKMV